MISIYDGNVPNIGETAVDSGGQMLVWNGNSWTKTSDYTTLNNDTRADLKIKAQAYLNCIGITDDIDEILAHKYPQHLI